MSKLRWRALHIIGGYILSPEGVLSHYGAIVSNVLCAACVTISFHEWP